MGHFVDGRKFVHKQWATAKANGPSQTLTCSAGQQIAVFDITVGSVAGNTASILTVVDGTNSTLYSGLVGVTSPQFTWKQELPLLGTRGYLTCSISATGSASLLTRYGIL